MVKNIIIASLSIAAIGIALPAQAEENDPPKRIVRFSDLNLGSQLGVAMLDRRIAAAINDMCGSADARDLSAYRAEKECRAVSRASVRDQRSVAIANATNDRLAVLAGR